jgi:hypothetical protein
MTVLVEDLVLDLDNLELRATAGRCKGDRIALCRAEQGAADRGDPAHVTAREIKFINTDNTVSLLFPSLGFNGDSTAEEHLTVGDFLLLERIDDFGVFDTLGKKTNPAVHFSHRSLGGLVFEIF